MVKGAVKKGSKVRVYIRVICLFSYIFIYVYLYVYLPCIISVCIYIFNTEFCGVLPVFASVFFQFSLKQVIPAV